MASNKAGVGSRPPITVPERLKKVPWMHGIKAISHSRRVVDISAPSDRESFDVVRAPAVNHLTGLGSLMAQPQVAPWQSAKLRRIKRVAPGEGELGGSSFDLGLWRRGGFGTRCNVGKKSPVYWPVLVLVYSLRHEKRRYEIK